MAISKKKQLVTFKEAPQNENEYRTLARDLLEWSRTQEALNINEFPISKTMAPTLFHTLPSYSEHFAQAYDIALQTIGARRERLARQGVIDKHIVLQTMPLYDPNFRKWILSTKDKTENNGSKQCVIVEIPAFNDPEPLNNEEK